MPIRMYVGGLSHQVQEHDLRGRFNKLKGTDISHLEIIRSRWTGDSRGFGYVEIRHSSGYTTDREHENFDQYCKLYHNTKWKGGRMLVRPANETFLEKIQAENLPPFFEDNQDKENEESSSSNWTSKRYRGHKTMLEDSATVNVAPPALVDEFPSTVASIANTTAAVESTNSSSIDSDSTDYESSSSTGRSMDEVEDDHESSSSGEEDAADETPHRSGGDEPSNIKNTSLVQQPQYDMDMNHVQRSRQEADRKRREALSNRAEQKRKQQHIPLQIDVVRGSSSNKKILFGEGDDEGEADQPHSSSIVVETRQDAVHECPNTNDFLGLSPSEDEEENMNDDEDQDRFKIRPEFQGSTGKKMFEMQKRFNGDERFRLDERFIMDGGKEFDAAIDDDENESDDASNVNQDLKVDQMNTVNADVEDFEHEYVRTQRILSQMYPNLVPLFNRNETKMTSHHLPLRFDPTQPANIEAEIPTSRTSLLNGVESESDDDIVQSETKSGKKKNETPLPEFNDSTFFQKTKTLNTMFTRVRSNSEDGIVGEAALDGIANISTSPSSESTSVGNNQFSLSSLFSSSLSEPGFKFDHVETGETLIESDEDQANEDQDDGKKEETDIEGEEQQDEKSSKLDDQSSDTLETMPTAIVQSRKRKMDEDFFAFGATFVRKNIASTVHHESSGWLEMRKLLTLDFKRKHKHALKVKKDIIRRKVKHNN